MEENINIRALLEELREKLNKLIEQNGGKMTQEIVDVSQQLDKIIVEVIKRNESDK